MVKAGGGFQLQSRTVGAMPIVNRVLRMLHIEEFLAYYVPDRDGRSKLPASRALGLLLRNLVVAREPLYNLEEWASRFDEQMLGLRPGELALLNDDRIGRSLQQLFLADRATLVTDVVIHAVKTFNLQLDQFHNDARRSPSRDGTRPR